jgi:serine/threonine protein kinase
MPKMIKIFKINGFQIMRIPDSFVASCYKAEESFPNNYAYYPPERFKNEKSGEKEDIWVLGVIIY